MAKGFIHGDIFWDNLLFDRERLTAILDFEEACQYYFLFDLGMTAVGCCADSQGFDMDKVAWMLKGYQTTLPLGRKEKNQYKIFMIYAAVSAAFWRFRQYNIRYPDQEKKNNYKELAELADQIRTMDQKQFMQIF
ncbi:MAG: phosphotransferase [Desulfobacter sp.]|nr:MAG: phosphotransferase [Desulfobacter sp.]